MSWKREVSEKETLQRPVCEHLPRAGIVGWCHHAQELLFWNGSPELFLFYKAEAPDLISLLAMPVSHLSTSCVYKFHHISYLTYVDQSLSFVSGSLHLA